MGRGVHSGGLRTQLLIGVATVVLAAPTSRWALAQDAAKWSPYIELGGMGGTRSWGDVDIFLPLWQDQSSLLFGDLRGTFTTQSSQEGNFGLGYRTQISPEWILGGYGYFDIQNSANDNLFYQVTLGAELKSVDWDFRLNGYIPINPGGATVDDHVGIKITGNNIQMQTNSTKEKALYGFDGEVGWRVPVFPADGNMDVRLYAGGYYFTNSDVDTIAGPRGRIEARLYDIDFLGMQSRLTAQGVVQWDSPRGVQGFGGLELRIPLGAITGAPGPKLNPLDRRMVDRVQRDVDIVTEEFDTKKKNEDVIVDELTVSTHTIVFANATGGGSGTQGSPTGLNGAPALAPGLNGGTGSNAIILVDGAAGPVGVTNPLQLSNGQALIGGDSTVRLTGVKTGEHINFRFPGERPTLTGNDSTKNLIQMASGNQNEVFGLDLRGQFSNGVYGFNMERAIVKETDIASASGNGILLFNTNPATSQFVHIADNTVISAGRIGINVESTLDDGSSFTQSIYINDNTVTHNSSKGIYVGTFMENGSVLSQHVTIDPNTVVSNGRAGIDVGLFVSDGAAASQSLLIADNVASANGQSLTRAGIYVGANADSGGSITQTALITGNTAIGNLKSGIYVDTRASSGSTITSTVQITGNTAVGNAANGIYVDTAASDAGVVRQTLIITDNTAAGNGRNGIYVDNFAFRSGTISQNVTIAGNLLEHNGRNGLYVDNNEVSSSTIVQSLAVANNTARYNDSSGILIGNFGQTGGSVSQTAQLTDNLVLNNASQGIYFKNLFNSGASLSQDVLIDPSTISGNLGAGILVRSRLYDGNFVQKLSIVGNVITSNGLGGIVVDNVVSNTVDKGTATLSQGIVIVGNTIAYNRGRIEIVSGSGGYTVATVIGGGINIALTGNNRALSGTVNLSSAIDISYNTLKNNFQVITGTTQSQTLGINISVEHSVSNGGDFGTVNMLGNQLTVRNNIFTNNLYGSGIDLAAQTVALNDAGGGGLTSGTINVVSNTTIIEGNVFDASALISNLGVNGSESSGITAGAINFNRNVTTIEQNSFGGGEMFIGNILVNGSDHAGLKGGSVSLANNATTFEGNTGGGIIISNELVNGSDSAGVSNGVALMASNHINIDFNTGGGAFIFNSVVNGSDSSGVTTGAATMTSNVMTIENNVVTFGELAIFNVAVNGTSSSGVTSGVAAINNNVMTIDDNTLSSGGIAIVNLGFFGDSSAPVTDGGVSLVNNKMTITGNNISYTGTSGATSLAIIVVDSVQASDGTGGVISLSDSIVIQNNTIAGYHNNLSSSGIFVFIAAGNDNSSGGVASALENTTISGNQIDGSITMLAEVGNSASNGVANMTNNFSIDDNVASQGIFVVNIAANTGSNGAVSMGNVFSIDGNDVFGSGFAGGISVFDVVANSGNNAAVAASMTNTFSIDDNRVSGSVFVVNEALNGTSGSPVASTVRMANAITIDRNTVSGGTFGVGIADIGANTGGTVSLSSVLDLEQNVISAQESSGMFFLVDSTSSAVSQSAQLRNNTIVANGLYVGSSLGGFGIGFVATQTLAGTAIQNFTLSGNTISANSSDGINTKASGTGASQTITLANGSGNHVNANAGFGAYLSNNGGTVVFNINGNDLSGNADGPFGTAGAGVTVNP